MIVAVSILGNPARLDEIRAFADRHGLYFMEDNCESLDSELNGRKTGTFGDLNTFSFFFSHQLTTGEGGMLLTKDREIADLARMLRAHGWSRDVPAESPILERGEDDFYEAYRFILPGYNLRPMEFAGAVGLVQMGKLAALTEMRRRNLAVFQDLFSGDPRFIIQRENGRSSSFCFTVILHPDVAVSRAAVLKMLRKEDIEFRIITGGCFPRHEAIRHFDYETVGDLPNAHLAHDRGFFVGNFPKDLTAELHRLREVLDRACG